MISLLQVVDENMEPIANQTSQLKLEVIGESWRLYVHTLQPKSSLIRNPKDRVAKLLNKGGNFLLKKKSTKGSYKMHTTHLHLCA